LSTKHFSSVKWSATKKSWYLPDIPAVRQALNMRPANNIIYKLNKIHPINKQAYANLNEQLNLKSYSTSTKRIYLAEFFHLLDLLNDYKDRKSVV